MDYNVLKALVSVTVTEYVIQEGYPDMGDVFEDMLMYHDEPAITERDIVEFRHRYLNAANEVGEKVLMYKEKMINQFMKDL